MGGNYSKSIYNQLMDVMDRLDIMESECKNNQKETGTSGGEYITRYCLDLEVKTIATFINSLSGDTLNISIKEI